jgi:secondary thiamine-phosphate synthase enzyme
MEDMTVESESVSLHTRREGEILDITDKVQTLVSKGRINNGVAFLFIPGSTAALTTLEHEPGLVVDVPNMLERIAPRAAKYEHEKQWHDGNGHSHVRAALIGPDLFVPFRERRLVLGQWQQIVMIEMDVRPRDRTVVVQLIGE